MQRFLSVHDAIYNHFNLQRHLISAAAPSRTCKHVLSGKGHKCRAGQLFQLLTETTQVIRQEGRCECITAPFDFLT
jgi:hypothetical protein